jgi:hypothetical protein
MEMPSIFPQQSTTALAVGIYTYYLLTGCKVNKRLSHIVVSKAKAGLGRITIAAQISDEYQGMSWLRLSSAGPIIRESGMSSEVTFYESLFPEKML